MSYNASQNRYEHACTGDMECHIDNTPLAELKTFYDSNQLFCNQLGEHLVEKERAPVGPSCDNNNNKDNIHTDFVVHNMDNGGTAGTERQISNGMSDEQIQRLATFVLNTDLDLKENPDRDGSSYWEQMIRRIRKEFPCL
jgi:hypothetical protein